MSDDETPDASDEATGRGAPSRLGRVLLGAGLAAQASEDFRDMDDTIEYAESAGVPMPDVAAPFASGMMIVAGVGIALWRLPRVATGAAVAFLTVVTAMMHDFWNADEDDKGGERLAFFGNLAMLGGALVFLREAYKD
ncbi:DoxX family protein [Halorubrum ezzemoulense]|uniref:DoxX family protein n=1 Tax=Halorubrum ezzemoulense TaxID=337243 RepID=UPI00232AAA2B|nr:DoxX family protein [Halorubrum ezzemoulense]MDB9248579.1 DoxX family protein [Halorubrum ezzemoulense]MDB9259083.1 DoxX family protein [Halorubrum ezzemoulense]MDB9262338.1 DoxX family protein [Halorubrum ezzemoulense]MDB9266102.1 DoxX family protein [Halorubrum ezzemoulense]MDB9269444.1 DoxX family protein [Halorubrum ezzemoulense]